MRVYKVKQGIILEKDNSLFQLENQNWDSFINDDNLFEKIEKATKELKPLSQGRDTVLKELPPPFRPAARAKKSVFRSNEVLIINQKPYFQ